MEVTLNNGNTPVKSAFNSYQESVSSLKIEYIGPTVSVIAFGRLDT